MTEEPEMEEVTIGVTWRHLVVTALATGVSAILAIYAVIAAPVAPFPGVSGLYLAAAIYVPLSLWLGVWGCLVGYFSQLILALVTTPFGAWGLLWSFADFIEGLIPLLAFRLFKADVDIGKDLENPQALYIILGVLVVNLIVNAFATALVITALWIITFILAIGLLALMYYFNRSKSLLLFIIFGIFGASIGSALIGVWIPILGGFAPAEGFWVGVIGWFSGDVIVLSAIATPMMITLTGRVKETSVFVEKWIA
ncbi:MAG: conserved membrane protein of unknown function [Promethearchaeota archaeon]|nr:MAG: conserved membrane protein of unknown function [Candidatus Lokiarchaeota archaeon]